MRETRPEQRAPADVLLFGAIVEKHEASVRRYLRPRTDGNLHEDDLVQQVFVTLWRRLDHVRDDVPPEWRAAWLVGVAKHVLAHHVRSEARHRVAASRQGARSQQAVDEYALVDERTAVAAALTYLQPADREVLVLANWAGLDGMQLGAALGCTPVAARKRLSRAGARFIALLGGDGSDGTGHTSGTGGH